MLAPSLADALRPELPGLAEGVVAAIAREVPDYARPLEGPFGDAVRSGVEHALSGFVDSLGDPGELAPEDRAAYVALGRGEHRAGRSLHALLSAYRVGARLSWDAFSRAGTRAGQPPDAIYALAGAIFTYIDAISAESVEGWTREQQLRASERAERRRALALLLARPDARAAEVADLATLAGWPLPARVAALAFPPGAGDDDPARLAARLGADVLLTEEAGSLVAWLPDPDGPGRRVAAARALGPTPAVLGPAVALDASARSLERARVGLRALAAGGLAADGLVATEDHRLALLLHGADPGLARDVADDALRELDALGAGPRARLLETLRAWLDHPGQVTRVAEELHVHPQTVRYRVARLRELLGGRLDEPDGRFALDLALRVRRRPPGGAAEAGPSDGEAPRARGGARAARTR